MPATIDQIAKNSGVSRISVVRALKGEPKVGPETRRRILEVARELGYSEQSNRDARMLVARRYKRTLRHGVLAIVGTKAYHADAAPDLPFHAQLFRGMEEGARQQGTEICLCPMHGEELPYIVRSGGVDGVLCMMPMPEMVEDVHRLGMPCVGLDCHAAASGADVGILPDGRRGIHLATRHLLDLGHRNIVFFCSPFTDPVSGERVQGFRDALRESKTGVTEQFEEIDSQRDAGDWIDRRLVRDESFQAGGSPGFTAVVCHNDIMAMSVVRRLKEHGLRVPEDISVVGFDDISLEYRFLPALTSVSFDREAMGRRAVELLCSGKLEEGPRQELFPVELRVRETSAAPLIKE